MFDVFDLPDMHNSCASRAVTTNAPQALLMLNSQLTHQLATRWASVLVERHAEDPAALVRDAYTAAFARPADAREIVLAREFLGQQNDETPDVAVVAEFCHALFNSNEFVYVD